MANIDNELNQIKNAIYGRDVRGSIHDGIKKINNESEDSKQKADESHDVMESIINDGFDNAALEANFEQKLNDKINNLQPEWTQFKEDTVTQLADSAQGLFSSGVKGAIKTAIPRPSLTIEDDDTRNELYEILYPFVKQKGIKISAAAITSRIGTNPSHINIEQFVEMRNSGRIEFCNHTHNHVHLADLTPAEIDEEIRLAEEFLNRYGIYSKHLVYPYGSVNDQVEEIASRYINSATQARDEINNTSNQLLRTFRISRTVLERGLESLKQKIDEIISVNGWLIINTHAHYPEFDLEKLEQIIDYAQSKSVDIITSSEGYKRFGNLVEFKNANGIWNGISANGYERGIFNKPEPQINKISSTGYNQNDSPNKYTANKITTMHLTNAQANSGGWELGGGVLFVDRRGGSNDYTYMIYYPVNDKAPYYRRWNSVSGEWEQFVPLGNLRKSYKTDEYTVSAQSRQNISFYDNDIREDDSAVVSPKTALPSGIVVNSRIPQAGRIIIELTNIRSSDITVYPTDWNIKILR